MCVHVCMSWICLSYGEGVLRPSRELSHFPHSHILLYFVSKTFDRVFSVSHANPCNIDMLHDLHAHIMANQHLLSLGITLPTCKTCFCCDADGLYHASSGWNVFSTGLGNRCTSTAWRTALWFVVVIVLVVYVMMRQWYVMVMHGSSHHYPQHKWPSDLQ